MKITISVADEISNLLKELAEKTCLKKSTIIVLALKDWAKKHQ